MTVLICLCSCKCPHSACQHTHIRYCKQLSHYAMPFLCRHLSKNSVCLRLTWLYATLFDEVLCTLQHVTFNARAAAAVYQLPSPRSDAPRHSCSDDPINFGLLNATLIQQKLLSAPLLLASMHSMLSRLIRGRRAESCCADIAACMSGCRSGCEAGNSRRGVPEQAWYCGQRFGLWQRTQPLS